MWTRRKFNTTRPPPPLFNSPISAVAASSSYHESWEEQSFAEDSAGLLGGCIWPPRSYTCSFCRREFRSAQALGGHMNVHRMDRARLKQSLRPADENSGQYPDQVGPLEYHGPNPNPNPNPKSCVMGSSLPPASEHTFVSPSYSFSNIIREQRGETCFLAPRSFTNPVPVRLSSGMELKLELGNWKVREVGSKGKRDWNDDDEIILNNKRRRGDAVFPSIIKPSSGDLQLISRTEVLKLSPSPVEELDLELRLGNPPKVK